MAQDLKDLRAYLEAQRGKYDSDREDKGKPNREGVHIIQRFCCVFLFCFVFSNQEIIQAESMGVGGCQEQKPNSGQKRIVSETRDLNVRRRGRKGESESRLLWVLVMKFDSLVTCESITYCYWFHYIIDLESETGYRSEPERRQESLTSTGEPKELKYRGLLLLIVQEWRESLVE